jgi:excisionase family DNA binding protein
MVDKEKLLLRPEDAAERLSLSRTAVYEMIADGRLPAVTVPDVRGTFVRVSDLNAWVRALVKQSAEAAQ